MVGASLGSSSTFSLAEPMKYLLFALLLLPSVAMAQSDAPTADIEGTWMLKMETPGGHTMNNDLQAHQGDDKLHLSLVTTNGVSLSLSDASFEAHRLHFVIPTDHALITCDLYQQEDATFSGVCAGPAGEFPASMSRADAPDSASSTGHK